MIEGKTKSGFKYSVDEESVESMEFVEALGRIEDEKAGGTPELIELVLGKDQKTALYAHVRGDRKFTPAKELQEEFFEILNAIGKKEKN